MGNKDKPERKRKTPPEISPKLSVLERKSRFERVQEKYKNQSCMKENREKSRLEKGRNKKERKPKTDSESDESLSALIKSMHADVKVMKNNLKETTQQIQNINSKITTIENENARNTSETNLKIKAMRCDMNNLETSVTNRVIQEFDPKINSLRTELREDINTDLRRLVREEMQLRSFKSAEEESQESDDSEEDSPKAKGN